MRFPVAPADVTSLLDSSAPPSTSRKEEVVLPDGIGEWSFCYVESALPNFLHTGIELSCNGAGDNTNTEERSKDHAVAQLVAPSFLATSVSAIETAANLKAEEFNEVIARASMKVGDLSAMEGKY